MEAWHIWLIIALVLVFIEIFTPGFAVICFSFGCVAACLCAVFKLSLLYQLLGFSVATILAFVLVRPLLLKYFFHKDNEVKTNVSALIGRQVVVCEDIDPEHNTGLVHFDGTDWQAVSLDNSFIEKNTIVEIVEINSIILTVKTLEK